MELDISLLPLAFSFLVVLVLIWISTQANPSAKLPPGPRKLPIIGNMHNLVGASPHRLLRDLAKIYGPIMHLKLGEVSTVVVSSSEIAREVMKTHDVNFSDRPQILAAQVLAYGCVDLVFTQYGAYWRQLRKICLNELLSAKRVQSFEPIRDEEVAALLRSISGSDGSPINLSRMFLSFTHEVTSRAAFSYKCRDKQGFLMAMKEALKLSGGFDLADLFPSFSLIRMISGFQFRLEKIQQKLNKMLDEILTEHKEKNASNMNAEENVEDLVDILMRLQSDGNLDCPITIESVKAIILDMFTAGSETSSTTMEWLMSELMKNPGVMQKAQAEVRSAFHGKPEFGEKDVQELSYLKLVVKETLRLHSPAPLLVPRECKETCELAGYEIPAKSKVFVNAWAIARDPQYWDDAESFRPERFMNSGIDFKGANFEFIPFGAGRRICPGMMFGIANIELLIAKLLYHFDWQLPSGMEPKDLDMTEIFGLTTCRKFNLCLLARPHIPLSK